MKNFKFKIQGYDYEVDILNFENNQVSLEVNGTPYTVEIQHEQPTSKTPTLLRAAVPLPTRAETKIKKKIATTGGAVVKSPLPGLIIKILVKEGDAVKRGDKLLIMEAMKMENDIMAEKEGVIKAIKVSVGDTILQNDVLFEIS